jgi:hypothetical protein
MIVSITRVDGTQITEINLPAPADVIVWGKVKPRYFVRVVGSTFREAIVAFVKGELADV